MFIASLLLALTTAHATEWPDLGENLPTSSVGERDAALLVGVSDYLLIADVPGAADNVHAWRRHLASQGVPLANMRLLTNGDAVRETILDEAGWVSDRVGRGGKLWVVFVGHGAPSRDGRDGLLVGADAQGTARSLEARSVRRSELLDALSGGRQGETVVVIDACFSGRASESDMLAEGLQPVIPTALATVQSATVLSAGRADQFAGPLPGLGRPAFSYLALGALRGWGDADGDGTVTATEVVDYANSALSVLVTDRRQEPQLDGDHPDLPLGAAAERGPNLLDIAEGLDTAPPPAPTGPVQPPRPTSDNWQGHEEYPMVPVPPDTFTMGTTDTEGLRSVGEEGHRVTLTREIVVGVFEVTQGLWQQVMGDNPMETGRQRFESQSEQNVDTRGVCRVESGVPLVGPSLPVACVDWLDAVRFANALSERHGFQPAYTVQGDVVRRNPDANGYRLPTEAEWEYAARAGSRDRWGVTGTQDQTCTYGNLRDATGATRMARTSPVDCDDGVAGLAAVGSFQPSGFGLYDTLGNAAEWTGDWYEPYSDYGQIDPLGPDTGTHRVVRGAGFDHPGLFARVGARFFFHPDTRSNDVGLRLVRTVE